MMLRRRGVAISSGAVWRGGQRRSVRQPPRSAPSLYSVAEDTADGVASTSGSGISIDDSPIQSRSRRSVERIQVQLHREAKLLQGQGKLQASLSVLYQGLSLYPEDMHMLSLAASLELKLGNLQRAEKLLRDGLRRLPMHASLLAVSGLLHARMGRLDLARKLFQTAHDQNPSRAATVLQVGGL